MTWTATKIDKQVSNGEIYVWVRFTSDTGSYFEPSPYRNTVPPSGWPDDLINQRVTELNAVDASTITLGPPSPTKPPTPPTQDQLDLQAWQAAKLDWQQKTKILESGLSKTVTQQDVDTAYALMKSLYKDEFGVFL